MFQELFQETGCVEPHFGNRDIIMYVGLNHMQKGQYHLSPQGSPPSSMFEKGVRGRDCLNPEFSNRL